MSENAHTTEFKNPIIKWIDHRLPIFSMLDHSLNKYPAPKNLNYMWNFGSLAGITLMIMIITGLFLAMQYTPHVDHAFESVERIMRDVNFGWLIRYIHMNGASFFFIVVYIHIFRGLYYGSYKSPRELLWILGVVIMLLMMATAFMGYVLPWGQMSFWGATVITNLFSAIPFVGESIVNWLWGGFSVDNATLNRFFVLHYLFPFLILAVVMLHLVALHRFGSNNPTGVEVKSEKDTVPFSPYYTVKDFLGLSVFLLIFSAVVFYVPNFMGHPDNYIQANPLQTPPHIVPEWYFLPFYAILRSITFDIGLFGVTIIEAKLGGVLLMISAVLVMCFAPWLDRHPVKAATYRPLYQVFYWLFYFCCLTLGWMGAKEAAEPWITISQICTVYYFAFFLVVMPILTYTEKAQLIPVSISNPTLTTPPPPLPLPPQVQMVVQRMRDQLNKKVRR